MRCVVQNLFYVYQLRDTLYRVVHGAGRHAVVLQREGNILRHRQTDKLPVGVLQNRSDRL